MKRLLALTISLLFATFFVAGCALQTRAGDQKASDTSYWHGRLSMQVDALPDIPASGRQSLTASFELSGAPDAGELRLFTPLGSTAAVIRWTQHSATLDARGESREFAGLDELTHQVLGASVPVPALFAWLGGQDLAAPGWQVDLSQFALGLVAAQRVSPQPQAHLRLVLEP